MAVPEQTPYKEYTANGSTTSFALGFICDSKSDLIVLVDGIAPPIATWSLIGGNAVFTTAPASGKKIVLQRNTAMSRTTNYQGNNNSFRPETINKDIDRVWLKLQELGVADMLLKIYVDRLHGEQKDYIDNKDQLVRNIISDLRNYVNQQDNGLANSINNLHSYVDQQDNNRNSYFENLISRQGVSLQQLDSYYNYLMQRLAQIAVDKGWDASFVVDGDKNQKEINAQRKRAFPSVLDNPKVKGDGTADDTTALQEYFRDADDNRKSSIFFPLRNHNYLIDAPLVIQEPLMIYGDAGATYNRGIGKDGMIIIGGDYAINAGNERTYSSTIQDVATKKSRNPADNWTFKNLSFIQKAGSTARTKTAIKHTAATDGPDRGLIMREVSGTGLKHVLHVTNQDKSTQLANVIIENCCISNCELPVFAEGMVLGLRFVGNQCEQNTLGAIKGTFNGPITIEDNMLEGQQNPFEMTIPPITGNRPKVSFKRNYLEANAGDFILKLITTSTDAELELAENYLWTATTKDFVQIDGLLGRWNIQNYENRAIAFLRSTSVARSSSMFKNVRYYKQYFDRGLYGASVYTSSFQDINKRSGAVSVVISNAQPLFNHPLYGGLHYLEGQSYLVVNQSVSEGDVIAVNLLVLASTKNDYILQCFNSNYSASIAETSLSLAVNTANELTLLTVAFKVSGASSDLRFRLYSPSQATGDRKLFGLCVENLGQHVAGVSKNIYPAMPDLSRQALFTPAVTQADSVATDVAGLKADFNALLAKLKASGQMQ